mmetsp:Transcript_17603/g.24825  ORF Transcript_17603/g.24825 Transcript_17603/m.24825 type:complete len:264 (+) Transcript_17603:25-816(+)
MKTSALALFAIIGSVAANRPQLSFNVKDGNFADIGGLDPSLTWSSSTKTGDIDIEYGVESSAVPSTDIASLPKKIWGKASTDISGWGVSARTEFAGTDFSKADVDVDASNSEGDLSLHLEASAGDGFSIHKVEATKTFDSDGARVTVNPRYDVDTEETDVVLAYSKDGTDIEVTASQDSQSLTFSRQVDDNNRVAPTLSSNGNVSVEWERSLGDDNSLTATLKPNESVDLEWKDAAWTANINLGVEGTSITGTNVSVKREVNF